MKKVPLCVDKMKRGTIEKEDMILFPFKIEIQGSFLVSFREEFNRIKEQLRNKKKTK